MTEFYLRLDHFVWFATILNCLKTNMFARLKINKVIRDDWEFTSMKKIRKKILVRFLQKSPFLYIIIFTQPLRSGRMWHKVNF